MNGYDDLATARRGRYAREFAALAARLERERLAAPTAVEHLLHGGGSEQRSQLVRHPDLQTVGALEYLESRVALAIRTDPEYALTIAQLSVAVAEGLADAHYPGVIMAQTRARAWRSLGDVLRVIGGYQEAIEAFHRGETYLRDYVTLDHDLALNFFSFAALLEQLGEFEEAQPLYARCRATFADFGDSRRFVLAGIAEGRVLQRMTRYGAACAIYAMLIAAEADMDGGQAAVIHQAAASCCIELRRFDAARGHLDRAAQIYADANDQSARLIVEVERGRLHISRGEVDLAIAQLCGVRRRLRHAAMHVHAAVAGLLIVEALLVGGRAACALRRVRSVVRECIVADLPAPTIALLVYLSDVVAASHPPATLLRDAREALLAGEPSLSSREGWPQ